MSSLGPALAAEPLLSAADVTALAQQIEAGVLARDARLEGRAVEATEEELQLLEELGMRAWWRFVRANLRLVAMVASQAAARSRLPEADLFQEGCLGLMVALQRFDHRRGYAFATYALFWIRSYVGASSARQLGALNLPTSRAEQLRAAHGVEAELAQRLGRAPRMVEVATALGRSERWTVALLAHRAPTSLDGLLSTHGPEVVEFGPGAATVEGPDTDVGALLDDLPAAERQVLQLRLGFTETGPSSLVETARRMALTVARVRRLEERGLDRLRAVCPRPGSEEAE